MTANAPMATGRLSHTRNCPVHRVQDIRISEQFVAMAKACGAPLPWEECDGGVCDADGDIVLEIRMPDPEMTLRIAALVVLAVNTCGSFRAVATSS